MPVVFLEYNELLCTVCGTRFRCWGGQGDHPTYASLGFWIEGSPINTDPDFPRKAPRLPQRRQNIPSAGSRRGRIVDTELKRYVEELEQIAFSLIRWRPLPDGTWPHLAICSGDRRFPPGEKGHSCCCRNCKLSPKEVKG